MNAQTALEVINENVAVADRIVTRINYRHTLGIAEVTQLLRVLRVATAAAQELQLRATNTPEPKQG